MPRKTISKKLRQQVFYKCNGHCAYCGCELTLKTMQVDHIESVFNAEYWDSKEVDNSIDNLMPACRQCNFYKGTFSLEVFRRQMKSLMERVRKPFIFRLAEKYRMVTEKEWDGLFYFEKNFFGKENPIEIYIKPIDIDISKDSLSEPIIYKK